MTEPLKDHQVEDWRYRKALVLILKTALELSSEEYRRALRSMVLQNLELQSRSPRSSDYGKGLFEKHVDRALLDLGLGPPGET